MDYLNKAKAGDIGGNTLGFYGATFEPTGKYIIAHGYQGALHLWKRDPEVTKNYYNFLFNFLLFKQYFKILD